MEGVSVSKYGLGFVLECLKRYFGDSWEILAVCLCGMIVSAAVLLRGSRRRRNVAAAGEAASAAGAGEGSGGRTAESAPVTALNWVLLVVLGLTVYNPFLVRKIVPKMGMSSVYYRAFWAFPFLPAAAYYLTELIFLPERKALRAALCAAAVAAAAVLMPLNPGIRYHLQLPDNVYKVYGSIPVICDAIHENFEQSGLYERRIREAEDADPLTKEGARAYVRTNPRCVFPYDMEFQVRQYDPSIILTFGRNMRLYYEGNRSTGVSYSDASRAYRRRKLILDAMYGRDPSVTARKFQRAMRKTRTNYLIAEGTKDCPDFLTAAGCTLVGDVAGYHIYSFGLEESTETGQTGSGAQSGA